MAVIWLFDTCTQILILPVIWWCMTGAVRVIGTCPVIYTVISNSVSTHWMYLIKESAQCLFIKCMLLYEPNPRIWWGPTCVLLAWLLYRQLEDEVKVTTRAWEWWIKVYCPNLLQRFKLLVWNPQVSFLTSWYYKKGYQKRIWNDKVSKKIVPNFHQAEPHSKV